ncbi:benzylsuccinate CoA-transferase BbsF subunit [Blastococcus colisei]|uniref:Benzylsuccinate CoA-transferase BbsF subunit n=1 Tax=Blastococcus colisei TaxID=1564162 RepID=A0A543P1L5_9ACTN|nr:CoA transferase [Blastococcus colisei]TQN38014.1 benzylsuccinate CoA-transferase BbsF subunit [Blastococcus colisei]
MGRLPLSGVRIADFTWVGAGSYTTKMLADHGADVIKIESSAKVDGIRLSAPFKDGIKGVNRSGYFADRNTSKRSITIDLRTEEGRALARRIVVASDVVANNFTPGTMAKFGLGYDDVREINPRAVYLAMSMSGDSGPERDFLGYGLTIGALVGIHHLSGLPNREPAGTGTNYPDHIPNPCHSAFAVLAALRHARRTGRGQYLDIAQTEPTIAVLGAAFLEATVNGRDPQPLGNAHRRYAPHGVYRCAGEDRWIAIAVTDDRQWPALRSALGLAEESCPAEWATEAARHRDREALDGLLAAATAGRDAGDLFTRLQAAGVPAGVVQDAADVVERDPHLQARGHWVRLEHPEMGETLYNAPPFQLTGTPATLTRPAPMLGQHTREICHEVLGLDDAEIARLQDEGVLA